jgi:4-diphosphocytidyl-2-C-methyl-D-erythritol kinase
MSVHRALAPAKVNLGLFMGPIRSSDGRHELVSVMQSISLADELTLQDAPSGAEHDEVICPGVPGPPDENLAAAALRAFRKSTGWRAPPQRLRIAKRIPVAAGLAGGSADAAGALRLARHASGLGDEQLLLAIAARLGADVPAQVSPGRWLATGAGERLYELPAPRTPFGVLVLPAAFGLSTGAVFAEADRLGLARSEPALEKLRADIARALEHGDSLPAEASLLTNDLQRAAISLRPEIADALDEALDTGAVHALLSGSGPTVFGLFGSGSDSSSDSLLALGEGPVRAELAAAELRGRVPQAVSATPVDATFAEAVTLDANTARGASPARP